MGLFPIDLEDEGLFALRIFDGEADASLAITDPLEDLVALQGEGIGKTLLEGSEGESPFARPRGQFPGAGETHVIAQDPRPFSLAAGRVEIIFGHRGDEGEALTGPRDRDVEAALAPGEVERAELVEEFAVFCVPIPKAQDDVIPFIALHGFEVLEEERFFSLLEGARKARIGFAIRLEGVIDRFLLAEREGDDPKATRGTRLHVLVDKAGDFRGFDWIVPLLAAVYPILDVMK